jgi:hypothetical protein
VTTKVTVAVLSLLTAPAPEEVLVPLETQATLGDEARFGLGGVAKRGGAPGDRGVGEIAGQAAFVVAEDLARPEARDLRSAAR